jgi:serine/threonine protein kinase
MPEPVKTGQRLEFSAEAHPGGGLLRLSGVIDESFDRKQIVEGRRGVLVLDLDGVRRITSFGVREWVTAMGEVQAACFFIRCRPAIVSQFNMVGNFAGRGQLVSLYAPYHCTQCDKAIEVLVDRRRLAFAALTGMRVTCPECQGTAEFDDIPETFFSYALVAPPLVLPPAAEAIIDRPPGLSVSRLRVVKEVRGQVTVLWLSGPLDHSAHLKRVADGLEGTVVVVLAGVGLVTDEGLSRFQHLTADSDARIYLTGVPAALARALRSRPEVLGGAGVLSARLTIPCPACDQRVDVDADQAMLQRLAASLPIPCPRCGASLGSPRVEELRDAVRLPLVDAPEEVRQCNLSARTFASSEGTPTLINAPTPSNSPPSTTPESEPLTIEVLGEPSSVRSRLRRYEILRRIASGGMGTVYLGRVVGAGGFERRVAIKAMHPHIARDPAAVAMFLDEARLAARIHHPNVVATLDIDQGEDGLFLVMEYVEGVTVRNILSALRRGDVAGPLSLALRLMLDTLAGLHAAHELTDDQGAPLHLVHRDVSPANLLVGVDGITRITDFGIVQAATRLGESADSGEIKGKFGYISPEQLRAAPVDRTSDVYSAGVVLWEMLTGTRAFRGDNAGATMMAAIAGISKSPSEIVPAVPGEISAACMRAVAYDRALRYPTAAAFAEDLERAAHREGLPVAQTRDVAALVRRLVAAGPTSR